MQDKELYLLERNCPTNFAHNAYTIALQKNELESWSSEDERRIKHGDIMVDLLVLKDKGMRTELEQTFATLFKHHVINSHDMAFMKFRNVERHNDSDAHGDEDIKFVCLILEGSGTLHMDGDRFIEYRKGDFIAFNPYMDHWVDYEEETLMLSLKCETQHITAFDGQKNMHRSIARMKDDTVLARFIDLGTAYKTGLLDIPTSQPCMDIVQMLNAAESDCGFFYGEIDQIMREAHDAKAHNFTRFDSLRNFVSDVIVAKQRFGYIGAFVDSISHNAYTWAYAETVEELWDLVTEE